MIKKYGNLIFLGLTLLIQGVHLYELIFLLKESFNNDFDVFQFVIDNPYLYSLSIGLTIIVSIVYLVKQKNKRNMVVLVLSLMSFISGYALIIYKGAVAISSF